MVGAFTVCKSQLSHLVKFSQTYRTFTFDGFTRHVVSFNLHKLIFEPVATICKKFSSRAWSSLLKLTTSLFNLVLGFFPSFNFFL